MPRIKGLGRGWFYESYRHSLAAKGIRTGRKRTVPIEVVFKRTPETKRDLKKFNDSLHSFLNKELPKAFKHTTEFTSPAQKKDIAKLLRKYADIIELNGE